MMTPQYIEKEARTVEEAVEAALAELDVDREQVTIRVLNEGSKGILGLGAKPAKVRVTLKEAPQESPEQILTTILGYMGHQVKIQSEVVDGSVQLNIESDNPGILIGRHGQTLDSLQYILNCVVNRSSLVKRRIILDIEGYREKRRVMLTELAHRLASKVKRTGQDVVVDPMPPQDRRIIHIALQNDERVCTFSRGEGPLRSVVITTRDRYESEYAHGNDDSR